MLHKFRKLIPYRAVPVLMYHQVAELTPEQDPHGLAVTPDQFAAQMADLAKRGVRGVGLDEVVHGTARPGQAVAITFDDGYADNYHAAFPVLREHGFGATIFLVTDWMGQTRAGEGGYQPTYLAWDQAREMTEQGIQFESHTLSHADLPSLSLGQAREELVQSRARIAEHLGRDSLHIGYPYGKYNDAIKQLAKEVGYRWGWAAGMSERDALAGERFCMGRQTEYFPRQTHALGSWLRGLRVPIP